MQKTKVRETVKVFERIVLRRRGGAVLGCIAIAFTDKLSLFSLFSRCAVIRPNGLLYLPHHPLRTGATPHLRTLPFCPPLGLLRRMPTQGI
ncbi:hypothetical protein RchiOBHm_Chr2g0125621 [Rosa chinensis]|uniref:Uncharacterized protein n=1 Tax=Rosa chinensis TaxID=74649 RepID=A0A2P6RTM9_ROSCH|nr:hypothetical protein RchiOBHm_Chr2g0125621 [Rosa chinensis]